MKVDPGKLTRRILCSAWDFVHFCSLQGMTTKEIQERFGVKELCAQRWRKLAVALGVQVRVEDRDGVPEYHCSHRQGFAALQPWFDRIEGAESEEAEEEHEIEQE